MKTILLLPLFLFPINDVVVEDHNSKILFINKDRIAEHNQQVEDYVRSYIDTLNYLDLWHLQDEPTRINLYSRELCFLIKNNNKEEIANMGTEFNFEEYFDFITVLKLGMGKKILDIDGKFYTIDRVIEIWHLITIEKSNYKQFAQ